MSKTEERGRNEAECLYGQGNFLFVFRITVNQKKKKEYIDLLVKC